MEAGFKGKNREVGATRSMVVHCTVKLLGAELDIRAATLLLSTPHKGSLVGGLVGVRPSHGSEDVVQALRGNSKKAGLEKFGPVVGRESSKSRSVDNGVDHFGAGSSLEKGRVVVTNRN